MTLLEPVEWLKYVEGNPGAHLLQTSAWGELKSNFGWNYIRVANNECGAQILFRRLPLGYTIAYIPKGPIGVNWNSLWPEIHSICKSQRAVFLRVEPDMDEPVTEILRDQMQGFTQVEESIQPRQTVLVDLKGSPEVWQSKMKQKTRYNTRLAEKKGVNVYQSQNFAAFGKLMQTTGQRDGFGVHTLAYYKKAYELFSKDEKVALLEAEFEGTPLAMLMVFCHGSRGYYLYGASGDAERQRMPAYSLQLEAMRWAASRGCTAYDMWGIPDAPEETLEKEFLHRSDGLWGVYRFKRGYGGRIVRSVGGFDYVYNPFLYRVVRWRMQQGRSIAG